ncbi:MAG: UDP-2,3-diacylglucosamine diphosphatase [Gemmatimonadota bacterium]
MSQKPVWIASDMHLGAAPPEREEAFYSWLEAAGDSVSHLILNGDVFDFWFEYARGRIPSGYDRVLSILKVLTRRGLPVTLMGGNHDWWGGRYLREEIGVEFLQDPVVRELAGYRAFLAHGDGLGRGDIGYRILRLILRGRLTRWAFAQLGPTLGGAAARFVSNTTDRWESPGPKERERAGAMEAWARDFMARRADVDLVVLGHTHIPLLRRVAPGRWYVNTGDWVWNQSYLELARGRPPRLLHWPE